MADDGVQDKSFDAKRFLKDLTSLPGVYRMISASGDVIYVGKARNLKKRVSSYFRKTGQTTKTLRMVAQIQQIEVTVTHTENEALILENNLIKSLKPRYNVSLRDSKGYPSIYLSTQHEFPRLSYHRGKRKAKGRYFGPFPNANAVRESLNLLQKLFKVRQCEDSFFRNRSRPCLQYQIRRCSAPCVNKVTPAVYQADIRHAVMFLEGRNSDIIDEAINKMDKAAAELNYEQAVIYRDQVASLRKIQEKQYISRESGDIDILACVVRNGVGCVDVFSIRSGLGLGSKTYFPKHPNDADQKEILTAFIPQFYLGGEIPKEIVLNGPPDDQALIEAVLSESAGHRVSLSVNVRGERVRWLKMTQTNAELNLMQRLASKANMSERSVALQDVLGLDSPPQRMECFDISHTSGKETVASCVVFDKEGPVKSDYRHFNISDITPGDDYAAMHQALMRRYTRLKKGEGKLPDILFIDGGKGQVRQAEDVMEELQISGVSIIGVAKGVDRIPGQETLYFSETKALVKLPSDSLAQHLIQQIRDEAHRFAITGHRQRRQKAQHSSPLDGVAGVGPKRRKLLLKQFGGQQGIAQAGVEDLSRIDGINLALAQRIYDSFH